MGTWGTAIFSDDTACDVRGSFTDLIGDGYSVTEATERILQEWKDSIADPDEGPVVLLALAATQWKLGRLDSRVKNHAVGVIDSGSDLVRWEGNQRKQRARVLESLRRMLESQPPPEKKVPKRFRDRCDWEVGELIAYTILSGEKVLFRVIGFHEDKGGRGPVCELLNWKGKELPGALRLRFVGIKKRRYASSGISVSQFLLGRTSERELPVQRVQRTGIRLRPAQAPGGYSVFLWRDVDKHLSEYFGIR